MSRSISPSLILLLSSLTVPPRPPLLTTSLVWPLLLFQYPPTAPLLARLPLSSIPNLGISSALEHYAISWMAMFVLDAIIRTLGRIRNLFRYRQVDAHRGEEVKGIEAEEILDVIPILRGLVWHLLACRVILLPRGQEGMTKMNGLGGYGVDLGMLIGLAGGVIASWGEVGRLLTLFGWNKDPQTGPSWTLSITHVVLSIHRLVLGIRILSAGISATSLV